MTWLYLWAQAHPIASAVAYSALAAVGVWALTGFMLTAFEAGCLGFIAWAVVFGRGL